MTPSSECPGSIDWNPLLTADLSVEQTVLRERHLESCPKCQQRLEQAICDAAPLLELARDLGDPAMLPPDPNLTRFMDRLQVLSPFEGEVTAETPDLSFLEPSDRPDLLGTLGAYEVLELVGQGGMGVVLRAFEPALHRKVAIKVMAASLAGSATARRRFTREAQAAAAVCHENIVAVHGVCESNGFPYIVMQYVDGESLQTRLDRLGSLDIADIARIGLQTASALAAAHAQGLIHRDIKPANILLENCLARVKITDFGLARMADDVHLTQNGVVSGTPEYMAPEQARGEPLDHRADLFSLGSVLYAMATGSPPFRAGTFVGVLRKVSDDEPRAVRDVNAEMPAWLETFIGRLHAKDPAQRIQTAAEAAALLEGYLAHLRQPSLVPPPALRAAGASKGQLAEAIRFVRRHWRIASAVALLAVAGSAVWTMTRKSGETSRASVAIELLEVPVGRPVPLVDGPAPLIGRLRGHTGSVHNVLFTTDGRLLSASGWPFGDSSLRVWDWKSEAEFVRYPATGQVLALDVSADGRYALMGLNDGRILDLDLQAKRVILPPQKHEGIVSWVTFAPDGMHAFSSAVDGTARRWRLSDGAEVQRYEVGTRWVRAGALTPDGQRLLTGGNNGVIQVWNVDTGKEIKRIDRHNGWINWLAVTPDGKSVLIADKQAALYDLDTGLPRRVFEGHEDDVQQIVLSPDGRRVLTGSYDGAVRLWDFATGRFLQRVGTHDGLVCSVAFSPDGLTAASAGGGHRDGKGFRSGTDYDIRLWDLSAWGGSTPPAKFPISDSD